MEPIIEFQDDDTRNSIIKVVGVGGGGCNAVNHMYRQGINDVTFLVCNTDKQALDNSPVPLHLQLGAEGLGAGNKPEKGRAEAEASVDDIQRMLDDGTKMTFVTAGMGGGTGTGAAPVVARVSKDMGILTVGIVTIPFLFEGARKIDVALDGVEEISKNVDALLVINNERLREVYSDMTVMGAMERADDILCVAARSISEIITYHTRINTDFEDARNVLKDGGVAIMSIGYGEGEGRLRKAIEDALNSPLLNDNDIYSSKKILLNISFAGAGLMIDEMNELNEFTDKFDSNYEIKWGFGTNQELGSKVKVTILATGFGLNDIAGMEEHRKRNKAPKGPSAEEVAERERRRETYYQTGARAGKKRARHTFFFTDAELDDNDIIYEVENSPASLRTLEGLKRLRAGREEK